MEEKYPFMMAWKPHQPLFSAAWERGPKEDLRCGCEVCRGSQAPRCIAGIGACHGVFQAHLLSKILLTARGFCQGCVPLEKWLNLGALSECTPSRVLEVKDSNLNSSLPTCHCTVAIAQGNCQALRKEWRHWCHQHSSSGHSTLLYSWIALFPHHWCILFYRRCRTPTHQEPAAHNGNIQTMPSSLPGLVLGGHRQQQKQPRAFSRNPRLVSSLFQRIVPPTSIFMKMYL